MRRPARGGDGEVLVQSLSVILQLAGAVALLLFGLGLVRDGADARLRHAAEDGAGAGHGDRAAAFVSGLVATLGLQSSTATALMTASFVDRGMIAPRMAQVVLGRANLGGADCLGRRRRRA